MNIPTIDVMLDLETLGVEPGCKIMQISAVTFNNPIHKARNYFDIFIKRDSQILLTEDPATLEWWFKQDANVMRTVLSNADAISLPAALQEFALWLESLNANVRLWGNGVRFDNAILEFAYKSYDLKLPWQTKLERCFRTLKAEFGHLVEEPKFVGARHNALHDATHQARYAEAIFKHIRPFNNGDY